MGKKPVIIIFPFTELFNINRVPYTRHVSSAVNAKSKMCPLLLKGYPVVYVWRW